MFGRLWAAICQRDMFLTFSFSFPPERLHACCNSFCFLLVWFGLVFLFLLGFFFFGGGGGGIWLFPFTLVFHSFILLAILFCC